MIIIFKKYGTISVEDDSEKEGKIAADDVIA